MSKIEKWKKKMREYYSTITREQLKKDLESAGFTVKDKSKTKRSKN